MTEKEMLDCLQSVWENMTTDKEREAYSEMLLLLDNMRYYLRYDLQIDYKLTLMEVPEGKFAF